MKDLKVSMKLIVSFLVVIVLMAAVGAVGIIGLQTVSAEAHEIYQGQMVPLTDLSQMTTLLQRMRVNMREYTIAVASDNSELIQTAKTAIDELTGTMTTHFDVYSTTMTNPEGIALFNEARELFDGRYQDFLRQSYDYAVAGDLEGGLQVLEDARADTVKIVENLDRCTEIRLEVAGQLNGSATAQANTLFIVIVTILAVAVAVSVWMAFYLSGLISKPLLPLATFMKQAGLTGDTSLSESDAQAIQGYGQRKDEIGQTISAAASFVARINEVSKALGIVAAGDLTVELAPLSDKDTLGLSLQQMIGSLNTIFREINSSSAQVSTGAGEVADGAQALAQGSTEQAATVQQLSASTSEIAGNTKVNADMAAQAAALANSIKNDAEKSNRQMEEMISAVNDINVAGQDIGRVIKVIDDIAFQTNILALNAAVEAARAGQHGKGFAVVADEVRNLAAKSAAAAKDTADLIANSIEKAEQGVRIAGDTSESLARIVSEINESSSLMNKIADSSEVQSGAITQINAAIDQVAQVVQQNSATAEESAAASEQMSSQSALLQQLISQFKTQEATGGYLPPRQPEDNLSSYKSKDTGFAIYSFPGGTGKY